MTPCNPCDNGACGSCVAEKLVQSGFIKDASVHCGCSEKGHRNITELNRPKVKSMFTKVKDVDPHIPEPELIVD